MTKGNLFVARHGETESNITKAIVGITDVFLTQKGRLDAHNLGANIGKEIDLIITSPQIRAIHSAEIIRKYIDVPIIEHPLLHPQNFGAIEGMTLDEARSNGLGEYLHKPDTDKYLHTGLNGESAKSMEARILPEVYRILSIAKGQLLNILLLSHNSISRCLIGNANNIEPHVWIENNVGNGGLFLFEKNGTSFMKIGQQKSDIQVLLKKVFENKNITECYGNDFLNTFAKMVLNEECVVLEYLNGAFEGKQNIFVDSLKNVLKNTIELNGIFQDIKNHSNVRGVYSVLQFGSSVYGKNYCVKDDTDLDIEIIIDENFDIKLLKDTVFTGYKHGNIVHDFEHFVKSGADYFSFKSYYEGRLIDFRITHKKCFDKIVENSLKEGDDFVMKEFRKQFRENGLVKVIKSFDDIHQWNNKVEYTSEGQIIHYPLFKYIDGKFTSGNNLDKYCSFTDVGVNEVEIRKKLFTIRNNFNEIFKQQHESEIISNNASIVDIFVRKHRFPQYLLNDLEYRYRIYRLLSNL